MRVVEREGDKPLLVDLVRDFFVEVGMMARGGGALRGWRDLGIFGCGEVLRVSW